MSTIRHRQFFLAKPERHSVITHVFTDLDPPTGSEEAKKEFPIQPFSATPSASERIEPLGREAARQYWQELKTNQKLEAITEEEARAANNYELIQALCLDESVRSARIKERISALNASPDEYPNKALESLAKEEHDYAAFKIFTLKALAKNPPSRGSSLDEAVKSGDRLIAAEIADYLAKLENPTESLLGRVCTQLQNPTAIERRTAEPTTIQAVTDHPLLAQVLSALTRAKKRNSKVHTYLSRWLDELVTPAFGMSAPSIPDGPSNPKGRKIGGMAGIG